MLKEVIKLVKPGVFVPTFEAIKLNEKIIVKPEYLSICAADMRYYLGQRPKKVLKKKLPLALIHEAIGRVIYDPTGLIKKGRYCVLLPGGNDVTDEISNYREHAFFRSSSADGFCQEAMSMDREEILLIPEGEDPIPFVFTELISVCCHALRRAKSLCDINKSDDNKVNVGVWGDGILGYLMSLVISTDGLCRELTVIGKHEDRMSLISCAHHKYSTYDVYENLSVDIAFECVGGDSATNAINDAIEHLKPCGILVLMGVSEYGQLINTRRILEKGITILGCSRSRKIDFETAFNIVKHNKNTIKKIFGELININSAKDLAGAFERRLRLREKDILEFDI